MQIGSSNPLSFLPGNAPTAAGQAKDTDAGSTRAAIASSPAVRDMPPQQDAAGVVLSLKTDVAMNAAILPKDLVYSNTRNNAPSQDSSPDTGRAAFQSSLALQRGTATFTSLSVDKEGVLVAQPASAAEVKVQAFMHHAVSAMREYADEQERLKTVGKPADGANPASLIPRSLAEVQKLAARFKLFA